MILPFANGSAIARTWVRTGALETEPGSTTPSPAVSTCRSFSSGKNLVELLLEQPDVGRDGELEERDRAVLADQRQAGAPGLLAEEVDLLRREHQDVRHGGIATATFFTGES